MWHITMSEHQSKHASDTLGHHKSFSTEIFKYVLIFMYLQWDPEHLPRVSVIDGMSSSTITRVRGLWLSHAQTYKLFAETLDSLSFQMKSDTWMAPKNPVRVMMLKRVCVASRQRPHNTKRGCFSGSSKSSCCILEQEMCSGLNVSSI